MTLDVFSLLRGEPKKASAVMRGLAAQKKVTVDIGSRRITAQPYHQAMQELQLITSKGKTKKKP